MTKPHLDREHLLGLYLQMLRIRRFEARCVELYQDRRIRGFLHLYDGEEGVAVGVASVLQPADATVATYREHGQALARGVPMDRLMAELMGRREGCCRGRGGSMHIFDAGRRFFGGNAIVGGGLPLAAGIAMADQRLRPGAITACFFGEGAVNEGAFHETMNLASLWSLPLLLVCENNLYAMGMPLAEAESQPAVARKAAAYSMESASVDGMDVVEVEAAATRAVDQVRSGRRPFLLECRTYRFRGHSMFDAQGYRAREEVEAWRERDPLQRLRRWILENQPAAQARVADIEASVEQELAAAVAFADAGTLEPEEELERFVTMDRVPQDGPGAAA